MSRIGKKPIAINPKVKVDLKGASAEFSGPMGKVNVNIPEGITCKMESGSLLVERRDDTAAQRSLHGLARQLLANAALGVEKGFRKELDIVGVAIFEPEADAPLVVDRDRMLPLAVAFE